MAKFLKEFMGGVTGAVFSVGGLAAGTIEAGYNKLNGMENDEISERFDKTVESAYDWGEELGEDIGEALPGAIATVGVGILVGKTMQKKEKEKNNKA